jgi:hypothetical protein
MFCDFVPMTITCMWAAAYLVLNYANYFIIFLYKIPVSSVASGFRESILEPESSGINMKHVFSNK